MTPEQPSESTPPSASETNRQSFTISGSTLSGNVQLGNTGDGNTTQAGRDVVSAGRDVVQGGSQPALTPEDVVALLQELKAVLQSASLPPATQEKALTYLETTEEEVQAEEPEKDFALKSFQRATQVLKDAGDTVEATTSLWEKVESIAEKLAPWFGVAVKTLLIL